MNGPIPLVQKKLGKTPSVPADSSRAHNPLRAPSNTTLVEEAARKALSAQELAETLERFRRLCRSTNAQPAQLDETAEVLRNAGFKQELMRLLREALSETGINPHVGALWIRRVVNSKVWDRRYPAGLDALCKQGEVGRRAVIEFLEEAGRKRRIELVLTAVSRHRKWLRREPQGWAAVVRALTRVRCYSKAVQWMAGWRDQGPLDLPTLHCLALALRATGQTQASKEVVNLALQNSEAAALFPIFILWTAQDQAFAGDTQGASATFKQINPTGWDDDSLALYYIVRGLIRVQKADKAESKDTFMMARERIDDLFRRVPIYKRDVFLRREYRLCVGRMARDCGAWSERITAYWRSAQSWPFLLALLTIPGLQLFTPCYLYRLCRRRRGLIK